MAKHQIEQKNVKNDDRIAKRDDKTSHGNTNSDEAVKCQHDGKISDKMMKHYT